MNEENDFDKCYRLIRELRQSQEDFLTRQLILERRLQVTQDELADMQDVNVIADGQHEKELEVAYQLANDAREKYHSEREKVKLLESKLRKAHDDLRTAQDEINALVERLREAE